MFFKKAFFLSFIYFSGFSVFSQVAVEKSFALNPKDSENFQAFSFQIDEVIDNRFDKTSIGIIQRGTANTRFFLDFETSLPQEIKWYLERKMPEIENARKYTLRVNEFFIKEVTKAFNEDGVATLNVDFLTKDTSGNYYFLGNYVANIWNDSKSLDVTGKHTQRAAKALKSCFSGFQKDFENGTLENREILVEKAGSFINNKLDDSEAKLFQTYVDFYNWNPVSDLAEEEVTIRPMDNEDGFEKYEISFQNKKSPSKYFIWWDGSHYYINSGVFSESKYYVKSYLIGTYLLFNENLKSNYYLAMGKSGLFYFSKQRHYLFSIEEGIIYQLKDKNIKKYLKEFLPDYYKAYKKEPDNTQLLNEILLKLYDTNGDLRNTVQNIQG